MSNLTQTSLSDAVKTFYEKRLLERALPRLVHSRFGKKAMITQHGSQEWRRYAGLSANTTALTEGTTPSEQAAPSITTVTATPLFYGAWIGYTDELDMTSIDPIVTEFSGILGEQAGLSIDTLVRNEITAGATKLYADETAASASLTIGSDEIAYVDFLTALSTLMAANARPFENGMFKVIMHPDTWATLYADTTFVNLFQQEASRDAMSPQRSGLMGTILMCEVYVSSNAREYADGGASNADVYSLLFIGQGFYGVAGIGDIPDEVDSAGVENMFGMTGQDVRPVEVIHKGLGSAGADDPLNQRGTLAWKANSDTVILNSAFSVDMEHLTTAS